MYNIVKFLLPILDKCSGIISLFFFIFWIIQMKYRRYIVKGHLKLIALVIEKVKENSGVTLEPEVRIIGEK